jgi:Calcineurin-like phosphoesterase
MIRCLGLVLAALLIWSPPAQARSAWDGVGRVVVVGDLHGDYAKFQAQLVQAGLIDAAGAWTGGKAHLVQLGDVPDRGAETRRILDLLIRLERQARRAGGYVHALIGNHESMNMEGDLRYVTPAEFAAFADAKSLARRDAYYKTLVAALKAKPPPAGLPVFDAAYRAKFDAEHPLGWVEHRQAWSPRSAYGRWIATHDAVIRVDDALYLHGGLGPAYLPFDAETMNNAVRAALMHKPPTPRGPPDILWHEEGPLWYRGLAQAEEAAEAPHLAALLAKHGVRHIIIGHTKRYPMINVRFDGAVILTDVAPPAGCPDPQGFLIKDGPTLTAVHRGRRVPLRPTPDYQAEITALDRAAGCTVR